MRRMWLPRLFFAVLVCSIAVSRCQAQSDGIDGIIRNDFPGYHVLTVPERDPDAKAFIVANFARRNPSIVHADFDGDGHLDYALLLKGEQWGRARFVILLCAEDERCRKASDEDITSSADEVFIRPVPIGRCVSQTDAMGAKITPPHVRLSSTAIALTYFEKATVVYYWNAKNKKIETI